MELKYESIITVRIPGESGYLYMYREQAWELYRELQKTLVGKYQGRNGSYT